MLSLTLEESHIFLTHFFDFHLFYVTFYVTNKVLMLSLMSFLTLKQVDVKKKTLKKNTNFFHVK